MSEYRGSIKWQRKSEDFTFQSYNRDHKWYCNDDVSINASSAPEFMGDPRLVNPEQAFVVAVSSCHMLTFLAMAAKQRFVVDEYSDDAVGYMEKNENGKLAITRIVLKPRVRFGNAGTPDEEQIAKLHDQAHRYCFIANSVKTVVTVE